MTFSKRILVTGGAGFIGSNFLNLLVPRYPQYHFVTIDSLTDVSDTDNIAVQHNPNFSFEKGDVRDKKFLQKIFSTYKPTDVINFAAETHVDSSIKSPQVFIETNVNGTANLLLFAREYGINRFHHISTDEVYGSLTAREKPFTEDSVLRPNNPYSASKAAAEHLVRAYHSTYGLDTVITRCSNNYGPRQDATKFIPLFITRFLAGEKAPLYSRGEHIRDWIYVDDHIKALDVVFHKGRAGETYNVGGQCEMRNSDVARTLLALAGKNDGLIAYVADRPGHDFRYALNCGKIRRELGWAPTTGFDEGIKKTFEFYSTQSGKRRTTSQRKR